MMKSALITIGTTPASLANLLRGINPVAGASASQTFGPQCNDQCRQLRLECTANIAYIGDNAQVSSTNHGAKLTPTSQPLLLQDAEADSLNLSDIWIVGSAGGTTVPVTVVTL